MTHRVPFRQTWPPLQDPRLNLGCCRYSTDWQCHCAGILPTESATVPVFYRLTVPLYRHSIDWQCHCAGILPTDSATVPVLYWLTVPLCRYSTDWQCHCAGILPTDSATMSVLYLLTVPLCLYSTDWQCHCVGIVPTDSATAGWISKWSWFDSPQCQDILHLLFIAQTDFGPSKHLNGYREMKLTTYHSSQTDA